MVAIRSFAKINLGLCIGPPRPDGFHDLRTVYQTIALHDELRVEIERGRGIELRCADARVPLDSSNTCYRIIERALPLLKVRGKVVVELTKRLPVQGGLGGASGNAVAALLGLERAAGKSPMPEQRLTIAAKSGSGLPLPYWGNRSRRRARRRSVPAADLRSTACVIALPDIGVSTPRAFAQWDLRCETAVHNPAACTTASPSASEYLSSVGGSLAGWRE